MATRILGLALLCAVTVAPALAQPAGAPLTLADALTRARTEAPALAAVRARIDAAREARLRAGRLINPSVELRSENWASGAPGGLPLDVFATVTQTVELGGKRGARRAAADASIAAAAAAEAITWREIARAITTDYLTALRFRDEARALTTHAESLAEAARVMGRRVAVGSAPEAELLKLRTEEARAVVARTRAELAAARALATLGAALGLDVQPDQLQRPAAPAPPPDAPVPATHPELVAANGAIGAARAAVTLERARGVPDVAVNAGVKRTSGYNTGVAAVTVPIPLFDRNGVARALAEGQLRAAEQERDAAERRLRGALASARAAAATLSSRAAEAQTLLVTPARGARDAARAAFTAGALDVLRLVDAERVFIEATLVTLELEFDAVAAALEARLAAGEEPLP
ncbi:MAG: TolC family protein [Acidobacteria bacterium]|nr:TolC family protein [Acidobacteriota bacterium]